MSRMYIANCTKQIHTFTYRIPDSSETLTRPRAIEIRAGGQAKLPDDLSTPQIDAVIRQHARYGMVSVADLDRTKPFAGMCYSIDKPVSVDSIRAGLIHNDAVLREQGKQLRQEAGVAAFEAAERAAESASQATGTDLNLAVAEISVIEVDPDKNASSREGDAVAEGVRLTRSEEPGPTAPRLRRRAN